MTDATKYSQRVETIQIINKVQNNKNWTASGLVVSNGMEYPWKYTYDSSNNKYKNDGGVLILESMGSIIEYPLIKMLK